MKIKKTGLFLVLFSAAASQASASPVKEYDFKFKPSLSIGYEQAHVNGMGNLKGVNAKVQLNSDYPFGFMASASYLKDQWETNKMLHRKTDGDKSSSKQSKAQYYSLMAGPTIKINEMTHLYGLAGMSRSYIKPDGNSGAGKDIHNHFAYGAGITANLTDQLVLTAGYEGSQVKVAGKNKRLDGGVINVGYQF